MAPTRETPAPGGQQTPTGEGEKSTFMGKARPLPPSSENHLPTTPGPAGQRAFSFGWKVIFWLEGDFLKMTSFSFLAAV